MIKVGDRVKIIDIDRYYRPTLMNKYIGKTGRVTHIDEDGDLIVEFEEHKSYIYAASSVEVVGSEFSPDDKVKILGRGREGGMAIGQIGTVGDFSDGSDIYVYFHYELNNGRVYDFYKPCDIEKVEKPFSIGDIVFINGASKNRISYASNYGRIVNVHSGMYHPNEVEIFVKDSMRRAFFTNGSLVKVEQIKW